MQLRLDAADRLVELVEERRGPVVAEEAARRLFALRQAPLALARTLLADVVESDARLRWRGDSVALAAPAGADLPLEAATYVVVDLETTGLRLATSRICEIGALRGLAQERGAQTVADVVELAATRTRRVYEKRHLAFGAPPRPGVYVFRDRAGGVLYVGRARDLRARLRSYYRSERQRPAVEAALGACERIEWRITGSELEAALEELRLIRELRPPANARVSRPDRYVWLKRRGDAVVASSTSCNNLLLGPLRSRRRAQLAARALRVEELERPALPLPRLRRRLAVLAEQRRFEDAARLRDRVEALERVCRELERLARLRAVARCLVVPALEPGHARAAFIAGGRVAAVRTLPPGDGAHLEIEAGLAAATRAVRAAARNNLLQATDLDELFLIGTFLRRPPPELQIVPLERDAILAAVSRATTSRYRIPGRVRERRSGPKPAPSHPDAAAL